MDEITTRYQNCTGKAGEVFSFVEARVEATSPSPKYKDKEWLITQYVKNRRSQYDIANECNCAQMTICHALKRLKIEARSNAESMRGKYHSEETKHKQSVSKVGKNNPMYGRKGLLAPMYGMTGEKNPVYGKHWELSEETCRKLSITQKEKWKDPVYKEKMVQNLLQRSMEMPSKPEIFLCKLIEVNNWPLKYTGNGSKCVAGLYPDFVNEDLHIIIEIFGRVFHDPEKSIIGKIRFYSTEYGRKKIFAKAGWRCLVIWEEELKEPQKVVAKVNNFLGVLV